ncbi:MAG: helix-turn-helix transcriptional regulator [Myxococcota bacterium]|nr:helix-turn-helix transcriptional regulator [Myxococcota bacterium]
MGQSDEELPFGVWLKRQRQARAFSQQELAGHLGVSAAHLSRVETGEKRLSADALQRAADLLGLDGDLVALRAGIVPPELLAVITRDPGAFRRWASNAPQ